MLTSRPPALTRQLTDRTISGADRHARGPATIRPSPQKTAETFAENGRNLRRKRQRQWHGQRVAAWTRKEQEGVCLFRSQPTWLLFGVTHNQATFLNHLCCILRDVGRQVIFVLQFMIYLFCVCFLRYICHALCLICF